jgi:hypothetical protein
MSFVYRFIYKKTLDKTFLQYIFPNKVEFSCRHMHIVHIDYTKHLAFNCPAEQAAW